MYTPQNTSAWKQIKADEQIASIVVLCWDPSK